MHRLKRSVNFNSWTWLRATSVYIEDKIGQGVGNVLIYKLCCGNKLCINGTGWTTLKFGHGECIYTRVCIYIQVKDQIRQGGHCSPTRLSLDGAAQHTGSADR